MNELAPSIVLVNMPIVDVQRPNLGLSLLQAILEEGGLSCEVVYGNLDYAERIGVERYERLGQATRAWFLMLLGEALFHRAAFPDFAFPEEEVLAFAAQSPPLDAFRSNFRDMQRLATEMVYDLAERIVAGRPRIVGCTSTFQQHIPSLALLRRIRQLDPSIVTMMGGANCETVMGISTHRNFPWVDIVVSGEADGLIVSLCKDLIAHGADLTSPPHGVYAPLHRTQGYPQEARASFQALDTLPYPHFDDYFRALQASPLQPAVRVGLPLETSRGCWWGAKHHCTFCGLNGGGLAFRRKSPQRALAEMFWMAERWGITSLEIVDNILDLRYLDTVIPELIASERDWNIFYEVKSNLRPAQMKAMAQAGIRSLQPGIESIDSRVLKLMDKGSRAWQQVQFLKFSREYGIQVSWNMLLDFPGEDPEWHRHTAELMPLLFHLEPPAGVVAIRYDRYSPYFEKRHQYGLNLLTHPMMEMLYPVSAEQAFDLCYHFQKEKGTAWSHPIQARLHEIAQEWRRAYYSGCELTVEDRDEELHFRDTRPCAVSAERRVSGVDRQTYLACQEATPVRELPVDSLQRLLEQRLVVVLDERCLSLAVSASVAKGPLRVEFPGGHVRPELLPASVRVGRGGFFETIFR